MITRTWDDFLASGVGAMYWSSDEAGRRVLWVQIPSGQGLARGEIIRLYCRRQKTTWSRPGPIDAWDGDETAPTMTDSIVGTAGWHGHIRAGELVTAADSKVV